MKVSRAALLLVAAGLLAFAGKPRRVKYRAQRIIRISRVVADLDRTEAFYRDTLGFETVSRGVVDKTVLFALGLDDAEGGADEVVMRLGAATIAFVRFDIPGHAYPLGSRSNDLWFQHLAIAVSDMDAAYAHLSLAEGWQAISDNGPQQLPPSNGGVRAFKFRDPDGHPLELIWFPSSEHKNAPNRRFGDVMADPDAAPSARLTRLFLTVDHSALSVSAIPRSLNHYRALGFRVSARSLNRGLAQERLDGLLGAHVRVTGLRPALGTSPGLELLGYRPAGRSLEARQPNDVATDWVTIEVSTLSGARYRPMRDPDGHLLLLVDQGSGVPD